MATKIEAFKGRGRGDFLASHDLEDVVSVVDGRETLGAEVRDAEVDLSEYVRREAAKLLGNGSSLMRCPVSFFPMRQASPQSVSSSGDCAIWLPFDRVGAEQPRPLLDEVEAQG